MYSLDPNDGIVESLFDGRVIDLETTPKQIITDKIVEKCDSIISHVAPLVTVVHPIIGTMLSSIGHETSKFIESKKHDEIISAIENVTEHIDDKLAQIKQDVRDIKSKPTKQDIKNETVVTIVNAIDFIQEKQPNHDYHERQQNYSRLQCSMSSLSNVALVNGYNDLSQILNAGNNLVGISQNFETLEMASQLNTLSLEMFAGTLGLVSCAFNLTQSIFSTREENGLGQALNTMANMISTGFHHVIHNIHILQQNMNYRFDELEKMMDMNHYQTIHMLFNLENQANGIYNTILHGRKIQEHQVKSIQYDIKAISQNLQSCSSLIQRNINAFREEKLIDILKEIDYFVGCNKINSEKIDFYMAKIMACFETVALNKNLTGKNLLNSSVTTETQIKFLQDAKETPYSVINVFSEEILGHPDILKVLQIYFQQLMNLLPTSEKTQYHHDFDHKMQSELDKIKNAKFINPFVPASDLDLLVQKNLDIEKRKMSLKVESYFNDKLIDILSKIAEITKNSVYRPEYILCRLGGGPYYDLAMLQIKSSAHASILESWNWGTNTQRTHFMTKKYTCNEYVIVSIECNGYSLEYLRRKAEIDVLLRRHKIYSNEGEFTKKFETYLTIGILLKIRIHIGLDEQIQIFEQLIDVVSEKREEKAYPKINVKVVEKENIQKHRPEDIIIDQMFGCRTSETVGKLKMSIACSDDLYHAMSAYTSTYGGVLNLPKVAEFEKTINDFFKLHDSEYKDKLKQNELFHISNEILEKLKAII